jgi:peptidoglycan/LPS O-acetylase OafA/YrhL
VKIFLGTRVASLDLLRGLAALAVAIPHYVLLDEQYHPNIEAVSVLPVEIFFVLSGFVLAPQIVSCVRGGRVADVGIFLARRWMRTLPLYFIALVAVSLLSWPINLADFTRYSFYAQNLFTQSNFRDYYPVAWSLSVEEWFYVSVPLIIFICAKIFRRSSYAFSTIVVLVLVGVIIVARATFGNYEFWGADVRRVVVYRIDSIGYGFLLYILLFTHSKAEASVRALIGPLLVAIVCTMVAVGGVYAISKWKSPFSEHLFPFYAAAFGAATIFLFVRVDAIFGYSPPYAWCCLWLGRISYGIYLFHLLVGSLLQPNVKELSLGLQLACYVAVVGGLSVLVYRYVERPILAARPSYEQLRFPEHLNSRRQMPSASGGLSHVSRMHEEWNTRLLTPKSEDSG